MRVLGAAVHRQLLDHGVAQRALGQHALDGLLECAAGVLGLHFLEGLLADAARVAGVAVVDLVGLFRAGDPELGGVDDDDEVAGIDVRRVNGLVLAAQSEGSFAGYPSEHLVGGVNHKPLVLHVSVLGADSGGHKTLEYGLAGPFPRSVSLWRGPLRRGVLLRRGTHGALRTRHYSGSSRSSRAPTSRPPPLAGSPV